MRVTSEHHVPRVRETRNVSVVSQKHCISLSSNFVTGCKVFELAKLGDTEGTSMSRTTCLLLKPGLYSNMFPLLLAIQKHCIIRKRIFHSKFTILELNLPTNTKVIYQFDQQTNSLLEVSLRVYQRNKKE